MLRRFFATMMALVAVFDGSGALGIPKALLPKSKAAPTPRGCPRLFYQKEDRGDGKDVPGLARAKRRGYLRQRLRLTAQELEKMVSRYPSVLNKPEEEIEAKLLLLQQKLRLHDDDNNDDDLRRVVKASPAILGYDAEGVLGPKLDYLRRRLGEGVARKIVVTLPTVLDCSVEENLEPTLAYLASALRLDEIGLRILCRKLPSVLKYSTEGNLEPKLAWLLERLSLDDDELRDLVLLFPQLLGLSVSKNLGPKLAFFEDLLGAEEAREVVLRYPSLMGNSLERRYKPRLEELREAGIPVDAGALSRMGVYSKERWSRSMAYQTEKIRKTKQCESAPTRDSSSHSKP